MAGNSIWKKVKLSRGGVGNCQHILLFDKLIIILFYVQRERVVLQGLRVKSKKKRLGVMVWALLSLGKLELLKICLVQGLEVTDN